MKPMEMKYKCSSICKNALFFYTQPISSAPTTGCLNFILGDATSGYSVPGTIAIICSIVMTIVFLFQYCLWCKSDEPEWKN